MAVFPDLATASLVAAVVFFGSLGILVVFLESIRPSRLVAFLMADGAVVVLFIVAGEVGVGLVGVGLAAAVLANQAFEWLTTR